jgi:hypothetical protein
MPWSYTEIAASYLLGDELAAAHDEIVAAFERCETVLGRAWMERALNGERGGIPTLRIVTMGQRLKSVGKAAHAQRLVQKLRQNNPTAITELHALHLLRSTNDAEAELFPTVITPGGEREPDFRIRAEGPWTYVEVTQSDTSEAQGQLDMTMANIISVVARLPKSLDVELYFFREPAGGDVGRITDFVLAQSQHDYRGNVELPDALGLAILRGVPSAPFMPVDYDGDVRPRFCRMQCELDPSNGVFRRIVVRVPYSDARADRFLRRKAAQLPNFGPGLIMVHMRGAPGGFTRWEQLLGAQFRPDNYGWVGGVCLFLDAVTLTNRGAAVLSQTKVIANPYAATPLPHWILAVLADVNAEWEAADPRVQ